MRVLAVAPCFDEASQYSLKWYERLRDDIADKVELRELLKDTAVRNMFESSIETFEPDAIVFYDHGSDDCLCAQDGDSCILDSRNVVKVAKRIVYTMACLSAKKLGAQAYAHDCVYVGYIESFTFTTYDEQLFCQAANSGFIAYVDGEHDWAEVKRIMIEAFNRAISQASDVWTKIWLQWDRDALRVYAPGVDVPTTRCPFRMLALKLFGSKRGWKIACASIALSPLLGWYAFDYRLYGLGIV